MNPKNFGAYTNGEGGVTALECAFEQVVACSRALERELEGYRKAERDLSEALNTGDGAYRP
jgi:hypothetical protein